MHFGLVRYDVRDSHLVQVPRAPPDHVEHGVVQTAVLVRILAAAQSEMAVTVYVLVGDIEIAVAIDVFVDGVKIAVAVYVL